MSFITIDPAFAAFLKTVSGLSGSIGGTTGPQAGPGSGQPSPQLQAFLDAIPLTNDGDVITADHHNTLRAAVRQIAQALDETQFARVVTKAFSPVLLPVVGAKEWRTAAGCSVGPATGGAAEGWMPLDLPNGTNVDTMTVRGKIPKPVTIWTASLRRLELAGSGQADVCTAEIQASAPSADGSFVATIPASTEGLTPAQAGELRRVDTTRYRYLFHTQMAGAQQGDAVELRLVQVTCIRG